VTHLVRMTGAPFIGALAIVGLWYLVILAFDIQPFLLPRPDQILVAFAGHLPILFEHSLVTLLESVGGLGVSIVAGVILAVLIAEVRPFSQAILPWLVVSQAIPKVAVAPLFVIWFGFGLAPKVIIAFFIAFFPIVISTASGLASVSREERDLFRTMTPRLWHLYRYLKIPRALPQFFDGVKVAATLALVGAVVGEFVSAQEGLGYHVLIANRNLQTALMFAGFVALSIVGVLLFYGVVLLERLLVPWHFAEQAGAKGERE
jgi:NitT/TauT family transport system permease protein